MNYKDKRLSDDFANFLTCIDEVDAHQKALLECLDTLGIELDSLRDAFGELNAVIDAKVSSAVRARREAVSSDSEAAF